MRFSVKEFGMTSISTTVLFEYYRTQIVYANNREFSVKWFRFSCH